jgi:predicted phosphoribosyltransferase
MDEVRAHERAELERRQLLYRGTTEPIHAHGLVAIAVDDGLATGASMAAAIDYIRAQGAKEIVVAAPVASEGVSRRFQDQADETICAISPEPFFSVGMWYDDFSEVTDDEVRRALLVNRRRCRQVQTHQEHRP